jgi:hypothetical protein
LRIFYVTDGVHVAGGQLVNLDHVAALRRLGYDARLMILRPAGESAFTPQFPPGREVPWRLGLGDLAADDVVVTGEMFELGARTLQGTPARRVLHNQGPFYTFLTFLDLPAIRQWGCEAMIVPSGVGADMLRRMGWDRDLHVVRPALDPVFSAPGQRSRVLQIATITSKRLHEIRLIRGILRSTRPDLNDVPWLGLAGVERAELARRMQESAIFLAAGRLEGLGLPPLEAMAAGALVLGFHAGGGRDYATPENGDWFDDGQHFEIAEALASLIDRLRTGEQFRERRAAGVATAARYSQPAFEAALALAWGRLVGPPPGGGPATACR